MIEYVRVNKNPKDRKTSDCSTRALCNILRISYDKALEEQFYAAKKYCYGITTKETIDKIMQKYGYVKIKQPRKWDRTKYSVNELDDLLLSDEMEDGVLVLIAGHFTVVRDYYIEDIWDCSNKTVSNYWTKEEYA